MFSNHHYVMRNIYIYIYIHMYMYTLFIMCCVYDYVRAVLRPRPLGEPTKT